MIHAMKIIDAHVHFVDLTRPEGVAWPATDSPLYRDFLPADLLEQCGKSLQGCVLVETSSRPSDNEWMLQLAEQEPLVLGVVANLNPESAHFRDRLSRLLLRNKFMGLRIRPIEQFDLNSRSLAENLEYLGLHGKTIELGATTTDRLNQYARLAASIPGTRCILDHLGHPDIDGAEPGRAWLAAMAAFAAQGNTYCKVSGLMGFARHRPGSADLSFYKPVLECLYALFGPDRLVYGSNWPPAIEAGSYQQGLDLLLGFFADKGQPIVEKFLSSNAHNLYCLAATSD